MILASPQFLLLLPLIAAAGWFFSRLQLWKPLRVGIILLIVFILSDPQIEQKGRGIDLWVLVDRSFSAEQVVEKNFKEWRTLLEKSQPGRHDRLFFVDFAGEVIASSKSEGTNYPGDRSQTRTNLAIQDTLARASEDRHSRILIFSDGYSTGPLEGVAEKLIQSGIPLDIRELRLDDGRDYRVSSMEIPERVQIGEPFLIDFAVRGQPDAVIPYSVYRGKTKIFEKSVEIIGGSGRVRFSDRVVNAGAFEYTVRLNPEADAHDGNNSHSAWVEVTSGPRIVLVSRYANDPLVGILKAQGFDVQLVNEPLSLQPGMLTGARSVILNNVPAYDIPNEFLEALDFFVTEQGGGLLMAGGKKSFGSGGYYQSAIDPLLPVTMELKSEHRKLAVAMAIVMDRSGSMAMTVNSGNSKMQLANEGAARAVELLGSMDAVTVFAVDSSAHKIAPLLNVGTSRANLIGRIRSIESMGGGIYVYTGMKAAWQELKKAEAGQRHMILFTDAADSEEPGEYKTLIQEMRDDGATISVIGLGTRSDSGAKFIEDIAVRGDGRIFFSNVPGDLPNIFAQETVTVARSTFIEDPVATQATGSWYELADRNIDWLPKVDGYNLSYLRKDDSAALISSDEYGAPLVAFGRRGIGRTAAVSFPLGGEFSQLTRDWDKVGDFVQTMSRWLLGESIPPGLGIRHEITGTELKVDLLFDTSEWEQRLVNSPPKIMMSRGLETPESFELTWDRIAPGHFSLRTPLKEGEVYRGAVQAGNSALPIGPLSVGTRSEWAFDQDRVAELKQTSLASGGRQLVDLEDAWKKPPTESYESIVPWLMLLLIPLFLFEAFVTRTGWKMPVYTRKERPARSKKENKTAVAAPSPVEEDKPEAKPKVEEQTAVDPAEARRQRFSRAKKRR